MRVRLSLVLALLAGLFVAIPTAYAVSPDEKLKDPKQEQRARDISAVLRCLVCQNQSIDDSNAGLAKDLRLLVRERIKAGDSNSAVLDYVVDKYGDFVLLKPPFNMSTLMLWLAPFLLLFMGIFMIKRFNQAAIEKMADEESRSQSVKAGLSDDEQKRLKKLMEE